MFYGEERSASPGSSWTPVTYAEAPTVVNTHGLWRIRKAGGPGKEVRKLGRDADGDPVFFVEVNVGHRRLGLNELRERYSPDGRFFGTQDHDYRPERMEGV